MPEDTAPPSWQLPLPGDPVPRHTPAYSPPFRKSFLLSDLSPSCCSLSPNLLILNLGEMKKGVASEALDGLGAEMGTVIGQNYSPNALHQTSGEVQPATEGQTFNI